MLLIHSSLRSKLNASTSRPSSSVIYLTGMLIQTLNTAKDFTVGALERTWVLHSPAPHHPLVPTAPGSECSLSIDRGQMRAGNEVRGAVLLQGPNWDVGAEGQQDPAILQTKPAWDKHRDPHFTQEWALASQLAFCLYCMVFLSAVCSGGSAVLGEVVPLDTRISTWIHGAVPQHCWACTAVDILGSFMAEIRCRVRVFLDPFLDLIHGWHGKGQSQEGCGCSLVVAWPHDLFYY